MVFARMTLVSLPGTVLTIFGAGYLADVVKPIYMIAPAFLGRSIVTYFFNTVEDPQSAYSFTIITLLIVFSTIQVVSLETLFMKNLPREVRGAMTILLTFFMESGALLYNIIGGPIFDDMGPSSPFVLVSIFDLAIFVFAIILAMCGYLTYGQDSKQADLRN